MDNPNGDAFSPNVPNTAPTPNIEPTPVEPTLEAAPTESAVVAEPAPETAPVAEQPVIEDQPIIEQPAAEAQPVEQPVEAQPTEQSIVQSAEQPVAQPVAETQPAEAQPAQEAQQPATQTQPTQAQPVAQPTTETQPKKKKSKKPLIFALIGILLAGAIAAVAILVLPNLLNGGKVNRENPKDVAEAYVKNLFERKFSENVELLVLPENHFITSDDYADYITSEETGRKSIIGVKGEVKDISEDNLTDNTASYRITVNIEEKDHTSATLVALRLAKNNNYWGVEEDDFYIKDWEMAVPGGTKITVGDKEAPESLKKEDSSINKNYIKYVFPAIYSKEKTFKLENKLDSKTIQITPTEKNSGDSYDIELNDSALISKAQAYIKDTWNALYTAHVAGTDVEEVAKLYFDDSMGVETVKKYYIDAFNALPDPYMSYFNKDYVLTTIMNGNDSSYTLSDDIITINFGYGLSWTRTSSTEAKDMTRYSKIRLKIDGESFKIYEVPDVKLFSYSNDYTHQVK